MQRNVTGPAVLVLVGTGLGAIVFLGGNPWIGVLALVGVGVFTYGVIKYSLRFTLVLALFFLAVFLPNRYDIQYAVNILGVNIRLAAVLTLLVSGALFHLVALQRMRGRGRGAGIPTDLIVAGLALVGTVLLSVLAAAVRAGPPKQVTQDSLPVITPMLLYAVLGTEAWSEKEISAFTGAIIGAGLGVTTFSYIVVLGIQSFFKAMGWYSYGPWLERPFQALGGGIAIGAFLLLVFPLALILYSRTTRYWTRMFYLLCCLYFVSGIIMQDSRLILAITVVYLLFAGPKMRQQGRSLALRYVTLAATALCIAYYGSQLNRYFERYLILDNPSSQTRIASIPVALRVFADHPLTGTGIGVVYPRGEERVAEAEVLPYRGLGEKLMLYGNLTTLVEPHNLYVMWPAELGVIGLIALIVFGWRVGRFLRAASRLPDGPCLRDALLRGFVGGIVAFCVQMMGSSILLNNLRVSIAFWIYLSVALDVAAAKLLARKTLAAQDSQTSAAALAGFEPAVLHPKDDLLTP